MAEQMTQQEQAEWEAYKAKQLGKSYKSPAAPPPPPPQKQQPYQSPADKQRGLAGALRKREEAAGNP